MIRFINRKDELSLLGKDWSLSSSSFVVVYGRRRIGKTRLIEEFLGDKKGVKYTAEDTNKKIQINEFKMLISDYLKDDFLAKQEISDWSSLFTYLTKILDKERRIYIWIDEFSYVIKNDNSVTSILQKFIDEFLRNSNIFLIVSGSLFGLMSEKILEHSSPLYGRRTRDILIEQIHPTYIHNFLDMKFEDIMKIILTLGGIPEYLQVASKYRKYSDFVNNEFLRKDGYFYREPYFLLSQEFKEIKTYFSILNAISYGNTKPSEIASFVGINAREIYPYLELLISYGFVKRETSFNDTKRGIYLIKDIFLDFWFNFVYKNREDIEKGMYKAEASELNRFFGKRFETLINENFNLFFKFRKAGRWWHKDKEVDIVALNEDKKEILFGECKWKDKVNSLKVLKELEEKAKYVQWNNEKRKESYVIFAKSFSKKVKDFNLKRVYCYDLKDIEKVLK